MKIQVLLLWFIDKSHEPEYHKEDEKFLKTCM